MLVEIVDKKKVIVTFEGANDASRADRLIEYAKYLQATAHSQARQSDIDDWAEEVNSMRLSNINGFDELLNEEEFEITPLVKSLCGVIKLPQDFDYKIEYGNHILQKYK